jgi:hypothetical protein
MRARALFLKCHERFKNGKEHRYWSLAENQRCVGGRMAQRQVLYVGEINDRQRQAWIKLESEPPEDEQDKRRFG